MKLPHGRHLPSDLYNNSAGVVQPFRASGRKVAMSSFALNGFRPSFDGLSRFLRFQGNFARLCEHKPVALQIVLHLLAVGGSSDLSEVKLALAVKRSPAAVASSLVWLEQSGAVLCERRSSGGVRLSSIRSVNISGAFVAFAGVLSGVARSIASVVRRVRALAVARSFRPRPSDRVLQICHTLGGGAERLKPDLFLSSEVETDPCQLLTLHRQGGVSLSSERISNLLAIGADLMGLSVDEYRQALRL